MTSPKKFKRKNKVTELLTKLCNLLLQSAATLGAAAGAQTLTQLCPWYHSYSRACNGVPGLQQCLCQRNHLPAKTSAFRASSHSPDLVPAGQGPVGVRVSSLDIGLERQLARGDVTGEAE